MELLSALVLFLLPFERIPSFDFHGVTIRISSLVILVFIIGWLPQLVFSKKWLPFSKIDKAALAYLVVAALSILVATNPHRSLLVVGLTGFVMCGYLLISRTYRDHWSYDKISDVVVAAGVITALFGLFQFFGDAAGLSLHVTGLKEMYDKNVLGFARIQSTGLEPLYYANFLAFPILVVAERFLSCRTRRFDSVILGLLVMTYALTLSRGGYIALSVGAFVLGVAAVYNKTPSIHQVGRLILPVIVAIGLALTSISLTNHHGLQKFTAEATNAPSVQASSSDPRLAHYKEAFRIWITKPILGAGIGNFGIVETLPKPPTGYDIVNNEYLEVLAETGIIGFVALVSLAAAALTTLFKVLRREPKNSAAIVLLAALFALGTQYNFFSTLYYLYLWVLLGLIDAIGYQVVKKG